LIASLARFPTVARALLFTEANRRRNQMKATHFLIAGAMALSGAAFAEDDSDLYNKTTEESTATEAELDEGVDDVDVDVNVDQQPAATYPTPSVTIQDQDTATTVEPRSGFLGEKMGLGAVKLMAGSGDFTQAGPRDITGVGPSWDVRGVFGAHSPVGLEAAYVGNARGIGGLGVDDQAALVSNGVEGDLRIAAPVRAGEYVDVRPFAFGGLGWQYMTLWGDGAVDGARDAGDHIMTIPAGVGIELGVGNLNIDLRGTYRHAVDSEIFGDATAQFDDPDALHQYNISAGLGFEF
jgi:hypothetical protein